VRKKDKNVGVESGGVVPTKERRKRGEREKL
jgi:hypothetical protein